MRRALLLWIGPGAALAAVVAAPVALAGRLPADWATHWSLDGTPDGHAPGGWLTAGVALAIAMAWAAMATEAARRPGERLAAAPWAWATIALLGGAQAVTVAANLDASGWRAADELSPWLALALIAAAGLAGLAARALDPGRAPAPRSIAPGERPSIGLAATEHAVWSGRQSSPVLARVGAATAAAIALGAVLAPVPARWIVVVAGLVVIAAAVAVSQIRVRIDRRGVVLELGPLGWPRRTIPLERIAAATTTELDPLRAGGWGVRRPPGRRRTTAYVLRGGEALELALRDGRTVLVTIAGAHEAAGLVNDLLARDQPPEPARA